MTLPTYWPHWYLKEAREVVQSLLRRLDRLEEISDAWQKQRDAAERIVSTAQHADMLRFRAYQHTQVWTQGEFFDTLEAFLAGWARLSLLFFPSGSGTFTQRRGKTLRDMLGIDEEGNLLGDRELRNAWMHFDERLDHALRTNTLGNRHAFVAVEQVEHRVSHTLRLMAVDTLVVHYRTKTGGVDNVDLRVLRDHLTALQAALNGYIEEKREDSPSGH